MVWVQVLESPRLATKSKLAATAMSLGSTGMRTVKSGTNSENMNRTSGDWDALCHSPSHSVSPSATRHRTVIGRRLPREGASPGGGRITRYNGFSTLAASYEISPSNANTTERLPGQACLVRSSGTQSAPSLRDHRMARKHAEVSRKQKQVDALRAEDQQKIAEKVDIRKQLREERFERLLDDLTGHQEIVAEVGLGLRKEEFKEQQRRNNLYAGWDETIYRDVQTQLDTRMNPPNRKEQQRLAGSKNLGFSEPGPFRLRADFASDPTKRERFEFAKEEAFDREAGAVLGWTARDPLITPGPPTLMHGTWASGQLPKACSRPVLEPAEWGQLKFQATMCGRFAQTTEQGPGARMGTRGGAGCDFAPDELDGVPAAGKRTIRVHGSRGVCHNDVGVLRSQDRGEAALYKTWQGGSSAAPNQDHYTYETGAGVTDSEFPLGKRLYCSDPTIGYGHPLHRDTLDPY